MFFTWKRDECETFDVSVSRAGLAGRPSIIPLLLKHRNESVTPYHRGELQWNPFGQAWRAEGRPGGDDTSDCWLLSAWRDDLKALPKTKDKIGATIKVESQTRAWTCTLFRHSYKTKLRFNVWYKCTITVPVNRQKKKISSYPGVLQLVWLNGWCG